MKKWVIPIIAIVAFFGVALLIVAIVAGVNSSRSKQSRGKCLANADTPPPPGSDQYSKKTRTCSGKCKKNPGDNPPWSCGNKQQAKKLEQKRKAAKSKNWYCPFYIRNDEGSGTATAQSVFATSTEVDDKARGNWAQDPKAKNGGKNNKKSACKKGRASDTDRDNNKGGKSKK